jgi:hypothetical protein
LVLRVDWGWKITLWAGPNRYHMWGHCGI